MTQKLTNRCTSVLRPLTPEPRDSTGVSPSLRSTYRSSWDSSLTAGLYSTFADRAALDKYAVSEEHVKVVNERVKPNVEGEPMGLFRVLALTVDVMAYDFELDN